MDEWRTRDPNYPLLLLLACAASYPRPLRRTGRRRGFHAWWLNTPDMRTDMRYVAVVGFTVQKRAIWRGSGCLDGGEVLS